MYLKKVQDYDKYSNEADIVVSDGKYDLLCYCYPAQCNKIGTKVNYIIANCTTNIVRVDENIYSIQKFGSFYQYHLQGMVFNVDVPMVKIGSIELSLDTHLPGDIKEGEFIEFDVIRLDCEIK